MKNDDAPVLRFPNFDKEWELTKLEDKFDFLSGFAFSSSKMQQDNGHYQLIKMSNVYKNELRLDRNPSYWDYLEEKQEKFLLDEGDIVLTLTGTVGKTDYGYSVRIPESGKYILNQRLVAIKPKKNISYSYFADSLLKTQRFYYYFFNESKGGTGNQSNVGIEDLRAIKLRTPSLPEQTKIADFLTSVDKHITLLQKKKESLEQYKKGIMQKIFSQQLRFKNENGNDFPDWEEKKLGDIGTFYYGKSAPKFSISQDAKTPCVRYGELYTKYHGIIDKIFSHTNIPEKNLRFSKGDEILIPRVGEDPLDFCKCSWLKLKNVAIGEMISVFNTEEHKLFIVYYIRSQLKYKFARVVEGGNVSNLYFRYLEDVTVNLPSLPEQQKIAAFLSSLDKYIEKVSAQVEQMRNWKKGLLQRMFV